MPLWSIQFLKGGKTHNGKRTVSSKLLEPVDIPVEQGSKSLILQDM